MICPCLPGSGLTIGLVPYTCRFNHVKLERVKRKDLIRELRDIARKQGTNFTMAEGGRHTEIKIGTKVLIVPRHREINELTAQGIIEEASR